MFSIRKTYSAGRLIAPFLVSMALASTAYADRLSEIKERGKLICATLTTSEPNGFQDPKTRNIVGFDVDLCETIAKRMGVNLEHKGVTVDARVPELSLGRVDLVAANLGYTKERAEQIDYTHSHFQQPIKVMVLANSPVTKLSDLGGQRVSAIRGSTSELFTRRAVPSAELVTFPDGPTAFLALRQGKAQGVAMTMVAAVRYINESGGQVKFLEESVAWEASGLGVKKGETALLAEVNRILTEMEAAGEIEGIWNKWYGPATQYKLPREKKLTPIDKL
jgi:polar amino acid transport system substrate-binding protein